MSTIRIRIILIASLFLLVIITGFVLRRIDKPYPALMLNVHKFLSLGALVLVIVTLSPLMDKSTLNLLDIIVLSLTGLFYLGALISGGLMDYFDTVYKTLKILHKISPVLVISGLIYIFYRYLN